MKQKVIIYTDGTFAIKPKLYFWHEHVESFRKDIETIANILKNRKIDKIEMVDRENPKGSLRDEPLP